MRKENGFGVSRLKSRLPGGLPGGKMESDLADLQSKIYDRQATLTDLCYKRDRLAKKLDASRPAPIQARSQF